MTFSSLSDLLRDKKDYILQGIFQRIADLPRSPYQDFALKTEEGRRRIDRWLTLLLGSLQGNQDSFFRDQARIGYERAIQGYRWEDVAKVYSSFLEIFTEILHTYKITVPNVFDEILVVVRAYSEGYNIVSNSYLKTREETIQRKVFHLQELNDYTHKIISIFEPEEIIDLTTRTVAALFYVAQCFIYVYRDGTLSRVYAHPAGHEVQQRPEIKSIAEMALREGITLYLDERGKIFRDIDLSQFKSVIAIPTPSLKQWFGVVVLDNGAEPFEFNDTELSLLNQFIYIMIVALNNAYTLQEIRQHRQELRLLTNKMISVQENERKRLAIDIHDTMAQTLAGISYQIQYLTEIFKRNPEALIDQFDKLLVSVNTAIQQSRELISSLHPELIDDIGLVPALQKHITNFEHETGITVTTNLHHDVRLSSEENICLFRVAQEALANVYKHADTERAEVSLYKNEGAVVLVVEDAGKGFNIRRHLASENKEKLGLLFIRERLEAAGGRMNILSGENRGCKIEATLFLSNEGAHVEKDQDNDC
jgi:signal transduction histidine kinase